MNSVKLHKAKERLKTINIQTDALNRRIVNAKKKLKELDMERALIEQTMKEFYL